MVALKLPHFPAAAPRLRGSAAPRLRGSAAPAPAPTPTQIRSGSNVHTHRMVATRKRSRAAELVDDVDIDDEVKVTSRRSRRGKRNRVRVQAEPAAVAVQRTGSDGGVSLRRRESSSRRATMAPGADKRKSVSLNSRQTLLVPEPTTSGGDPACGKCQELEGECCRMQQELQEQCCQVEHLQRVCEQQQAEIERLTAKLAASGGGGGGGGEPSAVPDAPPLPPSEPDTAQARLPIASALPFDAAMLERGKEALQVRRTTRANANAGAAPAAESVDNFLQRSLGTFCPGPLSAVPIRLTRACFCPSTATCKDPARGRQSRAVHRRVAREQPSAAHRFEPVGIFVLLSANGFGADASQGAVLVCTLRECESL